MNLPTVVARQINLASVVDKKMNTELPLLAENLIVKDVVEVSDTSKTSDKHVCSPVCADRKPLFEVFGSFLVLPSEECGNYPWFLV